MAALSAKRPGGRFAHGVETLRAKGRPGTVIVIAIARRLPTIANAFLRDGTTFIAT